MSSSTERGVYRNRDRATQLLRFDGLKWNTITPTDLDFFVDFGGRGFVLGEIKYQGNDLTIGQRLVIERAVDAWWRAGIIAVGFFAWHSVTVGDVFVAQAEVRKIRWRGNWHPQVGTVAQLIDHFRVEHLRGAA